MKGKFRYIKANEAFWKQIVSTTFVDGKLVPDRVNVGRDECRVNSVMSSPMKAFRKGNPRGKAYTFFLEVRLQITHNEC